MTTIACDGKTMAADSLVTTNSNVIVETTAQKMIRLSDGSILGTSGNQSDLLAVSDWLENGAKKKDQPVINSCCLLLTKYGLYFMDENLIPMKCDEAHALGSGTRHALTAMDCGKPPKYAVAYAMKRDPFTGGSVKVLHLEEEPCSLPELKRATLTTTPSTKN